MTPSHKRKLTQDEARFNAIARFGDRRDASIEQVRDEVRIHISGNARRTFKRVIAS